MCIKVCPSETIEFLPDDRKVKFYVSRCTFCELCTEICPKNCIRMSEEFLMANTDKYNDDMIITDSGNFTQEDVEEKPENKESSKPSSQKKAPSKKKPASKKD